MEINVDGEVLHVEVSDDGKGGADPTSDGLRSLADRVAAVGGQLTVSSELGVGTRVSARLPVVEA